MKVVHSLILALCLNSSVAVASPNRIVVGINNFPPLLSTESGKGIMTDIVAAAFQDQGMTVEFSPYPVKRILWIFRHQGQCAVVAAKDWFPDIDRYQHINIYNPSMHAFYIKEKMPEGIELNTLEDLRPYSIGATLGTTIGTMLQKHIPDQVVLTKSSKSSIKMLYRQRIDVVILSLIVGLREIDDLYPQKKSLFAISEEPIFRPQGYLVFTDQCAQHGVVFEKGLRNIWDNGKYQKILRHYHGDIDLATKTIPDHLLNQ